MASLACIVTSVCYRSLLWCLRPQGQQLVLSLEQSVPATATKSSGLTTLGGIHWLHRHQVYWVNFFEGLNFLLGSFFYWKFFLAKPRLEMVEGHNHTLFVSEAKVLASAAESGF